MGEISKRVRNNDGRMNLPLLTISARYGWMTQQSRFSASIAGREKKNYTLLKKHQLSYNHGNSKVAIYGTVYELTDYDEALVPKVYHSFFLTSENSSKFIESYFHTKKLDVQLRKFIASTARMDGLLNISFDDFMKVKLFAPERCEQSKISRIINLIEKLITLQQRKLEQLKQLKTAMLQQLFVDKNSKQPNLRFKNFNGNWKERKLGELYSYHNGRAHEQNQKSNGKYELINLNSISIDGTLKSCGRYINHANEILRQNDLVMILSDIAHGKLLGRVAIIPQDNKYVLNQRVALLRPTSKNINSNFMVSLINNNQRYFHKMGIGTSQLNISKSTVTESLWQVPKIKEQLVVGKFLQNSAHVINLQQSKIDQLNILKKYLLQKLFI
ncbi:restriction endonuclease subunit S [Thomasclavelia cocleata]|uniref:restriction endonuclease subunit S n=1 Tax=Thomasclavelia cocleata TaxID=69824 RepID=UPI00258529D6|nr:restriction endonuclease subunit S [Thomasclavelia cocleata]